MQAKDSLDGTIIESFQKDKNKLLEEVKNGFIDLSKKDRIHAPKDLKLKVVSLCLDFNVSQLFIANHIKRTEAVVSQWVSKLKHQVLNTKESQTTIFENFEDGEKKISPFNQKLSESDLNLSADKQKELKFNIDPIDKKIKFKNESIEIENELKIKRSAREGKEKFKEMNEEKIKFKLNQDSDIIKFNDKLNLSGETNFDLSKSKKQSVKFNIKEWLASFFEKLPLRILKLIFFFFVMFVFSVVCYLNSEFNQSQGDHKYLALILSFSCEAILFSIGLIQVPKKYLKNRFMIQLLIAISIIGNISIQITNRIILDYISTTPSFLREQEKGLEEKIFQKEVMIKNKSDSIMAEYKEVKRLQKIKYSKKASKKLHLIKEDEDRINRLLKEKTILEEKLLSLKTRTRFSKLALHVFLLIQRIALVLALWFLSRILSEMFGIQRPELEGEPCLAI